MRNISVHRTHTLSCAVALLPLLVLSPGASAGQHPYTVRDAFRNVAVIRIPGSALPVEQTVAESLRDSLAPAAIIVSDTARPARTHGTAPAGVVDVRVRSAEGPPRLFFRLDSLGSGELTVTRAHHLYALFCLLLEEWTSRPATEAIRGFTHQPREGWVLANDGFFAERHRFTKGYDPEAAIRELARLGCSHVSVNCLASPQPFEQGPPGEIYYRFYSISPDLDQFVETDLNRGTYPPEYLVANRALLKQNAMLARQYGLVPGITICSPRSVPESLLRRYPYLRGARVDHPYRSYQPRYTLTLSHPAVRWHYAELMRALMREVPDLGYVYLWTNDSGSGFEYVSTLYAGRNGGAYLIREWKSNEEVAKAAGENVVRYFRTLRDAASEINPEFRIISSVSWFGAEAPTILDGLDQRLDLQIQPGEVAERQQREKLSAIVKKGSRLFGDVRIAGNYILGIPFPWLTGSLLQRTWDLTPAGARVFLDPPSLSPWNVNREVMRSFLLGRPADPGDVALDAAVRWAGEQHAPALLASWYLIESAVKGMPDVPLYGNSWAFPWYRLWVRPLVPDMERIPPADRAAYERHMIATFNNPTLVDPARDALWLLMSRTQADSIVAGADRLVWPSLDRAILILDSAIAAGGNQHSTTVLRDQRDRARALRCYMRTLRNTAAWIAAVHGYLESTTTEERNRFRRSLRAMMEDEIVNARALLQLWAASDVNFMPVSSVGESWSAYGDNFGHLLERKISLMAAHMNDTPSVDPDFMWRLAPDTPLSPDTYRDY